jgi:hypothetical protein
LLWLVAGVVGVVVVGFPQNRGQHHSHADGAEDNQNFPPHDERKVLRLKIILGQSVELSLLVPVPPHLLPPLRVLTIWVSVEGLVKFPVVVFPVPVLKPLLLRLRRSERLRDPLPDALFFHF